MNENSWTLFNISFSEEQEYNYVNKIALKYEGGLDIDEGFAKLRDGTLSFLESRASLTYMIRSNFTNK